MFSKTMFLCALLVLHSTLGFPQNSGFDPTKLAGAFFQPLKDVKEKQIMPLVGLFGAPLGALSQAGHGIVKRTTNETEGIMESIKEAKKKHIESVFGFFGDQFDHISKAFNALGSSSKKEE